MGRPNFLPLLALLCTFHTTLASFIVEAPCGKIEGAAATSVKKQSYLAFRNIPYAKPPVGYLRFRRPRPHPKIDGILDASKEKITICPQPIDQIFIGDKSLFEGGVEDCLILNVYVPKLDTKKRKVVVFIHGGGFILGSSREFESGTFVVEQDVIMVTINYRLAMLGFLSTENDASPGNYGLWDQALALKWVKDNIGAFGGDADDIAISGESAGSASVTFQCISPYTKGLFTKAFSQSGTSTAVFAKSMRARANALAVATSSKCWDGEADTELNIEQSQSILDCLRKLPFIEIAKFTEFSVNEAKFVPRIDGYFIPKLTSQLLQDDAYLESIGFFDRKYLFAVDNSEVSIFVGALDKTKANIMSQNDTSEEEKAKTIDQYLESIWTFYLNSRIEPKKPTNCVISKIKEWYQNRFTSPVAEMVSDLAFLIPSYDYLEALTRSKNSKSWLLYFNHYPHFMKGKLRGIGHGFDLAYWFDYLASDLEKLLQVGAKGEVEGDEELKVKEMFASVIGDFVRTGNLTGTLKEHLPSGWPTFDLQGSHYLDFSLEPRVNRHLGREKRDLWLTKVPEWIAQAQEKEHTKKEKREEL